LIVLAFNEWKISSGSKGVHFSANMLQAFVMNLSFGEKGQEAPIYLRGSTIEIDFFFCLINIILYVSGNNNEPFKKTEPDGTGLLEEMAEEK
jgi:hypothetical protein